MNARRDEFEGEWIVHFRNAKEYFFPWNKRGKKIIGVKELYGRTREIEVAYLLLSWVAWLLNYVECESHLLRESGGGRQWEKV